MTIIRATTITLTSLSILIAACSGDRADSAFDTAVAAPAFSTSRPRLLFDAGHHNHHTISSTYRPFADLMRNDGFLVEELEEPVTAKGLHGSNILAIVTAMGKDATNSSDAFTALECSTIERWVSEGGSLLLVTDHFPFGPAVATLASRFGVTMSGGMTFDENHHDNASGDDSQLVFSRENRLLADHQITRGVNRVVTFTGQSLRGGTPLLLLSDTAVNRSAHPTVIRDGGDVRVQVDFGAPESARGWSQAVALEHGRGRVIVTAEAAMLTAQRSGDRLIGMNLPGCDNRRFVLNAMHWLSRLQ
jgi:hypothetical protein